jgi:hypothetical protein
VPAYRRNRVYIGTFSPYPGSIGCETASLAARLMHVVQVFTGSPFSDTDIGYSSTIKGRNIFNRGRLPDVPARPALSHRQTLRRA